MPTRLVNRARKLHQKSATGALERLRQNRESSVLMPVTFAQGLSALNDEQRKLNKSRRTRLAQAWEMALQDIFSERAAEIASHCEVRGSFGGSLRVSTDSPAMAHELGKVKKQALLEKLRELLTNTETLVGLEVRAGR